MAFADGLNATVAIERNTQTQGPRGGVPATWVAVIGLEAVPCRIVEQSSLNTNLASRPNIKAIGKALFAQAVDLDQRNRLVYQDPKRGRTRYLVVRGQSRNAHEMSHHWVVEWDEYAGATA